MNIVLDDGWEIELSTDGFYGGRAYLWHVSALVASWWPGRHDHNGMRIASARLWAAWKP
jgi:hypothetical protein